MVEGSVVEGNSKPGAVKSYATVEDELESGGCASVGVSSIGGRVSSGVEGDKEVAGGARVDDP